MWRNKIIQKSFYSVILCSFLFLVSCSTKPQPIKLGDACSFCKMGVADARFGAEIITKKGKAFKFDDAHCLIEFMKAKTVEKDQLKSILFVGFDKPHDFIDAENAYLLKSENLRSPMGSNIAAYQSETALKESQAKLGGEEVKWASLESQ